MKSGGRGEVPDFFRVFERKFAFTYLPGTNGILPFDKV